MHCHARRLVFAGFNGGGSAKEGDDRQTTLPRLVVLDFNRPFSGFGCADDSPAVCSPAGFLGEKIDVEASASVLSHFEADGLAHSLGYAFPLINVFKISMV